MKSRKYDLAVIGGGPAGMIAAGHAAELGSRVALLEKNKRLGVKLSITGKGRCNITNARDDLKELLSVYGHKGRFLRPALTGFSNKDVVRFFDNHGLRTKVERGRRVFPVSDNSGDVVGCLARYVRANNVEIRFNSPVERIVVSTEDNSRRRIEKVILKNGDDVVADKFVFATGGKSYPATGSTGDAYRWLKKIGHAVIEPRPALTPIIVKERIVGRLEGLSLKNVELSLWRSRKLSSCFGEALFTGNGLSGPIALDLSKEIDENKAGDLKIRIDFKPALDHRTLDKRIQRDFEKYKNKQFGNCLHELLPRKLIPVIIELSGIQEDKKVNEVTRVERKKLIALLKEFELSVKGLVGFEKAIVTSGGVDLKEVDPKTMKSRIVDNLYFAGEILDIDGPTGGYNLQVAWSTGHLVAESSRL